MKKIYLMVACVLAMSMSACGSKTNANVAEEDSLELDTEAVLDEPITVQQAVGLMGEKLQAGDTQGVLDVVNQVKADIEKAIAEGDVEAAAKYASQIKEFVDANKDKLESLNLEETSLQGLVDMVKGLPGQAQGTADAAAAAVQADANAAGEAAKAAAQQAVEEAKAKAAAEAEAAKQKAAEEASKAIDNAAAGLKKKMGI